MSSGGSMKYYLGVSMIGAHITQSFLDGIACKLAFHVALVSLRLFAKYANNFWASMPTNANVWQVSLSTDAHNNAYESMRLAAIMPSAHTGNMPSSWEQFSDHVICKITIKINRIYVFWFHWLVLVTSERPANIFLDHLPFVKGHRELLFPRRFAIRPHPAVETTLLILPDVH